MILRKLPFSQVIEQKRRRWMPFRQALAKEDQAACDRMFACAAKRLQAEVQLGRAWRVEAVVPAVLLEQLLRRLEEHSGTPVGRGVQKEVYET
jgi:hypothetical protein